MLKIPSRQNVIDWTSTAWDSIDVDIIIRSFLRCGISNAVDGSEDDEIRDEIPRDIEADITDGAHNEEDCHRDFGPAGILVRPDQNPQEAAR